MGRNQEEVQPRKAWVRLRDLVRFDAANAMFGEDTRFAYPERRFIALGLLDSRLVQVVYAEVESGWRVISLRPASRKERKLWQRE